MEILHVVQLQQVYQRHIDKCEVGLSADYPCVCGGPLVFRSQWSAGDRIAAHYECTDCRRFINLSRLDRE